MTKAESQANLAYPEDIIDASPLSAYPNWIDRNLPFREGFVKGYEQAEKDSIEQAMECELVCIKDRLLAVLPIKEFQWTAGDKIKIIIVKE